MSRTNMVSNFENTNLEHLVKTFIHIRFDLHFKHNLVALACSSLHQSCCLFMQFIWRRKFGWIFLDNLPTRCLLASTTGFRYVAITWGWQVVKRQSATIQNSKLSTRHRLNKVMENFDSESSKFWCCRTDCIVKKKLDAVTGWQLVLRLFPLSIECPQNRFCYTAWAYIRGGLFVWNN